MGSGLSCCINVLTNLKGCAFYVSDLIELITCLSDQGLRICCLRHRPHHLSAVRRRVDHTRGDRRSLGDRQDSGTPGLGHASATNDLSQSNFPPGFRFSSRANTPLCPLPQPTRHHGSPCLARSWDNRLVRPFSQGELPPFKSWRSLIAPSPSSLVLFVSGKNPFKIPILF